MIRARPHRRGLLAGALALSAAPLAAAADAPIFPPMPDEMSLGNPKAKVSVIEYASLSCPHCAVWANEVFPAFKAKFVDTGKVRYELREFITGPQAVAEAGWLTARCAGPAKYFDVVAAVFRGQAAMYASGDIKGALSKIAADAGLTQAQFDACLADQPAFDALVARVTRYARDDKIDATPTFVVGAVKLQGEQTLEQLSAAIATASKRRR